MCRVQSFWKRGTIDDWFVRNPCGTGIVLRGRHRDSGRIISFFPLFTRTDDAKATTFRVRNLTWPDRITGSIPRARNGIEHYTETANVLYRTRIRTADVCRIPSVLRTRLVFPRYRYAPRPRDNNCSPANTSDLVWSDNRVHRTYRVHPHPARCNAAYSIIIYTNTAIASTTRPRNNLNVDRYFRYPIIW